MPGRKEKTVFTVYFCSYVVLMKFNTENSSENGTIFLKVINENIT